MPFSPRSGFSVGPLPPPPDDNIRPHSHGCGTTTTNVPPTNAPACHPSHGPPAGVACSDTIAHRPSILDDSQQFPESSPDSDRFDTSTDSTKEYVVRALSRSALRMLWHQCLGHLNFRRLSEMHRFVKGMPQFTIPTEIEECPICLASKLRKAPSGKTTTMRATTCNQGLSIDFGFMVQKSRDSARHNNLVGLNGEKAFATKARPVEWINNWLASNAPQCPSVKSPASAANPPLSRD